MSVNCKRWRANTLCIATVLNIQVAAWCQEAAVPANAAKLCTIRGRAVKANSDEGLSNVAVHLQMTTGDHSLRATATLAGGEFTFNAVEPGRYVLTASAKGYTLHGQGAAVILLTLAPSQHAKDIVLRLRPTGVITGTVTDESGEPAANATVQVLRIAGGQGRWQANSAAGALTNDRGEYRVFGLDSGQYLVLTESQPAQPASGGEGDEVFVPVFFPGTTEPGQATTVSLAPGDEVSGINLTLKSARAVHVRGRVRSEKGALPSDGVTVSLAPRGLGLTGASIANYQAEAEKNGVFEITGVPAGSYVLSATWSEQGREYFGATDIDVHGTNDLEGVVLSAGPGIDLHGRVLVESGEKGVDFSKVRLWLQPSGNSGGAGQVEMQPDGDFLIPNVYDGSYRLRAGGFPETYRMKVARLGGRDVLGAEFPVTNGHAGGQLDILLAADGGTVTGAAFKEQQALAGARVVLVPDAPNRDRDDLYRWKTADSRGSFSIQGVPPGNFHIFAFQSADVLSAMDARDLQAYEPYGVPVQMDEKGQVQVQVEAVPASKSDH